MLHMNLNRLKSLVFISIFTCNLQSTSVKMAVVRPSSEENSLSVDYQHLAESSPGSNLHAESRQGVLYKYLYWIRAAEKE